MNKQEYIAALRQGLSGLPIDDAEERLNFYSEMIDDQVEEGKSEEEAVAEIGSAEDVVAQILSEVPLSKIVKKKMKSRRLRSWEIVLLAVGSPVWLSLGVAAFAVVLSLYAVLWSLVISAWAVFASCAGCAVGGIAGGVLLICTDSLMGGLFLIFASLVAAGLSIFLFFGCRKAVVWAVKLTERMAFGIKRLFIRKGAAV